MSILTHSPSIVRDGLVLCLDAGLNRSTNALADSGHPNRSISWPTVPVTDYQPTGCKLITRADKTITEENDLRKYGNNVVANLTGAVTGGGVSVTYVDHSNGFYGYLNTGYGFTSNPVVGRRYRMVFRAKTNTGYATLAFYDGVSGATMITNGISTTMRTFTYDFTCAHATSAYVYGYYGMGSGEILYVDRYEVYELSPWLDVSGHNNHAEITNAPTFSAESGAGGTRYFDFDGSSDYMTISNPSFAADGFTNGLTCEAWLRFDTASLSGSDTGFITRYSASAQSQFLFGFREAGVGNIGLTLDQIDDSNNAVGLDYDQDWTPATDRWYHVVAVYIPSTKVEIFVDGQSEFSVTSNIPSQLNDDSTLDVMIGNYVGGTYFNGRIAILRMYDRALTIGEAQQNYRTHKGRFGK